MEPEITAKSTKNEILDAYHAVLAKLKEQRAPDRQAEKLKAEKREIVATAAQNSVERIVKGLAELKLGIVKALDELEEQLTAEFKKLNTVRQAIEIEQRNLEEIHEIRADADSLAALLLAQKEKREAFEAEIEQKRTGFDAELGEKRLLWKKEQDAFEQARKEREEQVKKTRQREEEEYAYNRDLERKKDLDSYAARKAALDKELDEKGSTLQRAWSEREATLAAREDELAALRARVDAFPKELEKGMRDTERSVTEKLQFAHKHQAEMLAKETEGEKRLSEQRIASLEAKIKEQDEQIRQLTQKANEAGLQVQSIAIKAIEGASAWRALSGVHERAGEPQR